MIVNLKRCSYVSYRSNALDKFSKKDLHEKTIDNIPMDDSDGNTQCKIKYMFWQILIQIEPTPIGQNKL